VAELKMLVLSSGAEAVGLLTCSRTAPDPKYFIGSGKTEELKALVESCQGETVIFNHELSPSQERNLESFLGCRVITRTALILDIFAARARTREGKLQVELAQLGYLETRLVRGWTHLERQRGGFGLRGGPGETQLEYDRRLLKERVNILRKELREVEKQREQNGRARSRRGIPVVSLVGYTNSGKSTLFNTLTDAGVYAADQLFATLDPTLRTVSIPRVGKTVFADTVGFIRDLPHNLVAAFKATLREARESDLALMVIDSADGDMDDMIAAVEDVMEDIGAGSVPVLKVFNKIDRIPGISPHIEHDSAGLPRSVSISAKTGAGVDLLLRAISDRLGHDRISLELTLPPDAGALRQRLFEMGAIESESYDDSGKACLRVTHSRTELARLSARFGGALERYVTAPASFSFRREVWED
jgi:GTP-binding protein HflX